MKTTINRLLELTKESIASSIGFYDWEEDDSQKEVFSYISNGKKDYGAITVTVYQKIVCPSVEGTWDEPSCGFEAEYYIDDAEVSIFNKKGDYLQNVSEAIKELLKQSPKCK